MAGKSRTSTFLVRQTPVSGVRIPYEAERMPAKIPCWKFSGYFYVNQTRHYVKKTPMTLTQCNTLVCFTSIKQMTKGHVNTWGLKAYLHTVIINSGKYFLHTQAVSLSKHAGTKRKSHTLHFRRKIKKQIFMPRTFWKYVTAQQSTIIWFLQPCRPIDHWHRRFVGTYHLRLRGRRINHKRN